MTLGKREFKNLMLESKFAQYALGATVCMRLT